MKSIIIRKAKSEELPQIQELCNALGEQSYSFDDSLSTTWASGIEGETYYKERILGQKGVVFVVEIAEKIVGFSSATVHEPDSWRLTKRVELDNIYILKQARSKGIGKMLLARVMQFARDINAERVVLTAFARNEKAIAFYKREDFTPYELTLERKVT